jgi:hypothetical protein
MRDASICPRCKAKVLPTADRPDLHVLNPIGLSFVIEAKFARGTSFPFSEITPGQRTWLSMFTWDGGLAYIALGTDGIAPRRYLWIVPWDKWLEMEAIVRTVQASLPIENPRRIEARERGLDAVTLLAHYACTWIGGDQKWLLPKWLPKRLYYRDPADFREQWATMKEAVEAGWDTFYQYWRKAYGH